MSRKGIIIVSALAIAAITIIVIVLRQPGNQETAPPQELTLLCWAGFEEREVIEPFEKKYNVKVRAKTYGSGDAMFTLLSQSHSQYDVVVADQEYVGKLHDAGRLSELNTADFDLSDYFAPFQKFPVCWIDNKLYAIVVEFGASGLVYNSTHLSEKDVKSYSILDDPRVKGKLGIWDWYLPNMGVLSLGLGNADPFDISESQFINLKQQMMKIRPQVGAIHSTIPEVLSALANDQTWVVPGAGEWVAAVLRKQGKPVDWTVPDEGGLLWVNTLVIPNDAPHSSIAKLFLQWSETAAAQAALSQKQAYCSNVPNKRAYELMPEEQKSILKIHNATDAISLLKRLSLRRLPVKQSEKAWQEAWGDFKAR